MNLINMQNEITNNEKIKDIIPLLDQMEMRNQALKKADLIWESSVYLHES